MSGLPNPNKEIAEVLTVVGAGPLNESRERLARRRAAFKLQLPPSYVSSVLKQG